MTGIRVRSELYPDPVDITSEEWRHECECRYVLDAMTTREQRNQYLYGNFDGKNRDYGPGSSNSRKCVAAKRGVAQADRIKAGVLAIIAFRKEQASKSS